MFDQDTLKKAIQNTLNADITIPNGHKVAFTTIATTDGVHTAFAAKVNDHWVVDGEIGFKPGNDHNWEYGVTVQATW